MGNDRELWAPEVHYFATHALGFATADTREGAIEKLLTELNLGRAGDLRTIVANHHKDGEPGLYIWTARVHAEEGSYRIEWYMPKDVEADDAREHYLTYFTKKKYAVWDKPVEESLAGRMKEEVLALAGKEEG